MSIDKIGEITSPSGSRDPNEADFNEFVTLCEGIQINSGASIERIDFPPGAYSSQFGYDTPQGVASLALSSIQGMQSVLPGAVAYMQQNDDLSPEAITVLTNLKTVLPNAMTFLNNAPSNPSGYGLIINAVLDTVSNMGNFVIQSLQNRAGIPPPNMSPFATVNEIDEALGPDNGNYAALYTNPLSELQQLPSSQPYTCNGSTVMTEMIEATRELVSQMLRIPGSVNETGSFTDMESLSQSIYAGYGSICSNPNISWDEIGGNDPTDPALAALISNITTNQYNLQKDFGASPL